MAEISKRATSNPLGRSLPRGRMLTSSYAADAAALLIRRVMDFLGGL
jgi:hypothetical protein